MLAQRSDVGAHAHARRRNDGTRNARFNGTSRHLQAACEPMNYVTLSNYVTGLSRGIPREFYIYRLRETRRANNDEVVRFLG